MADFQPLNLAQLYQGADAAVASAMQTNLMTLQASKMKQEFDVEDQLRTLARRSTVTDESGNTTFNRPAFTQGAYGVDPLRAMAFEKSDLESQKVALEMKKTAGEIAKTQEDTDLQRMKLAGDRLKAMNEASTVPFLKYKELIEQGVSDEEARQKVQPLHETAIKNLITSGLFKPEQLQKFDLPQQFDPTKAEAGMRQVLGTKDALAQYWDEKRFGQTERHHQDSMTMQIRGQNITLRGQDLTDARAKETLAQQGLEVKETGDGNFVIIDKKNKDAESVVDKAGKPVQGKSSLSESQGKALGFGQRAVEAHNIILGLESGGTKYPGQIKQAAGSVPLVGGALETGVNALPGALGGPSENQQKIEQAQRDFINAVLRPESGATITPQEFDNAKKQYFTQPGDTDKVIKQKQEAREREITALKAMAGPGAKQFPEIKRPDGTGGAASFASEADAEAAAKAGKLKKGDKISVGGKPGTWQ